MHRQSLIQTALMIAFCTAGLVACEGHVEVPTLMPTLPAAAPTIPVQPTASQAAQTQPPVIPVALETAATPAVAATPPITATQTAPDAVTTPGPGLSGADLDQALEQYQQDLNAVDMTDVTSDSLETSAEQALNQFGQSLDSADTLSDVGK